MIEAFIVLGVYLLGVYFAVRTFWYTNGREVIGLSCLSWVIPLIGVFFMDGDERNGLRKAFYLPPRRGSYDRGRFLKLIFNLKDD